MREEDIKYIHELENRVQELEDIIYQDERQAVLEGLYEENKRYREALEFYAENAWNDALAQDVLSEVREESE